MHSIRWCRQFECGRVSTPAESPQNSGSVKSQQHTGAGTRKRVDSAARESTVLQAGVEQGAGVMSASKYCCGLLPRAVNLRNTTGTCCTSPYVPSTSRKGQTTCQMHVLHHSPGYQPLDKPLTHPPTGCNSMQGPGSKIHGLL